ncbi:MAG: ABC transporter [Bacteroidetes bacterium]|nr:MAG: ABC transporter [Bacteroidota bacterium]
MKYLRALNKYFWKYRWRLILGIVFIILSNYFRILTPQVTGFVVNSVKKELSSRAEPRLAQEKTISDGSQAKENKNTTSQRIEADNYDVLVKKFIRKLDLSNRSFGFKVAASGITLLVLALIGGFFMFLMRQTIIVMSRHIEYDQKNEIFRHYQLLDTNFYKTHSTGDLMSRMAEDVSRVRMYTGPAIMYLGNLLATIGFSLFFMIRRDALLTLYVLAPLPILAVTIYYVNTIIHKKSEHIQALLSSLTTNAQESYSGIRVIKSFVQEKAMYRFFEHNSEDYRKNAIGLAKIESIYFPAMGLIIGLSTLLTIMVGGLYVIRGEHGMDLGTITEFVIYITMLVFPVSAIGWVASMVQRAAASQKRLNEFLETTPQIRDPQVAQPAKIVGNISFRNVEFIYPNTGIHAVKHFNLDIRKGEKIAIIGRTGSGKTTIAQLLLRFYDPTEGSIHVDGIDLRKLDLQDLRKQIGYVPQDVFLFSDTVTGNILFGMPKEDTDMEKVRLAAKYASVEKEIQDFPHQYETTIGERGVTLSGGQKQRISIARALIQDHEVVVFDDCLSAVDTKTEKEIIDNLYTYLKNKTAIIITHRIFSLFDFDRIVVLDEGKIVETGTHRELLALNGYYTELYEQQQLIDERDSAARNGQSLEDIAP